MDACGGCGTNGVCPIGAEEAGSSCVCNLPYYGANCEHDSIVKSAMYPLFISLRVILQLGIASVTLRRFRQFWRETATKPSRRRKPEHRLRFFNLVGAVSAVLMLALEPGLYVRQSPPPTMPYGLFVVYQLLVAIQAISVVLAMQRMTHSWYLISRHKSVNKEPLWIRISEVVLVLCGLVGVLGHVVNVPYSVTRLLTSLAFEPWVIISFLFGLIIIRRLKHVQRHVDASGYDRPTRRMIATVKRLFWFVLSQSLAPFFNPSFTLTTGVDTSTRDGLAIVAFLNSVLVWQLNQLCIDLNGLDPINWPAWVPILGPRTQARLKAEQEREAKRRDSAFTADQTKRRDSLRPLAASSPASATVYRVDEEIEEPA